MNNTKQPEALSLDVLATVTGGFGGAGWSGIIGSAASGIGNSLGFGGGSSGGASGGTAAPSTPAPSGGGAGGGLGGTSMGIGAQNLLGSFSGAGKIN